MVSGMGLVSMSYVQDGGAIFDGKFLEVVVMGVTSSTSFIGMMALIFVNPSSDAGVDCCLCGVLLWVVPLGELRGSQPP